MLPQARKPTTPGEILKEEFLTPLGMTQQELADATGISRVRVNNIVNGKRSITPDTAFRLARFFDTTPEFWMSLQMSVDLWTAGEENRRAYSRIHPVTPRV
ncbi:MAG: HigA family addiction module antitoxin [Fidelibacterota bacterium]